MQRWNAAADVPGDLGPSALTIGTFDGVHRGHRELLARVTGTARERDLVPVAITFHPHPLAVLHPERAPAALTSLEHRLELLASTGLGAVLVMTFTRELASWSPERFVAEVMVDALRARAVVVGRDMRFGHRNSGDVDTLRSLGERHGFEVVVLDDATASGPDGTGRRWSSSWARELIAAGDVEGAQRVLGRPHRVAGTVVHGDHRGRGMGYPTANLARDSVGVVPADGVYAGWLSRPEAPEGTPVSDLRLPAAVSVGTNPTFDGTERRVEAYVLDRDDLDLYGETVCVDFTHRLRPTVRFEGMDALLVQMADDVARSRALLGAVAAPGFGA